MTRFRARVARTQPRHTMNKLEEAYAWELEKWKREGIIKEWKFEAITLKLAFDTRYTPDFMVIDASDVVQFHETKGPFRREDSFIKIKVAVAEFPFFDFFLVTRDKETGAWVVKGVR
jgi:hypothetical protein